MKFLNLVLVSLFLFSYTAQSTDRLYTLIEKVVVAEHSFEKGRFFLSGIQFANKSVEEAFIVPVIGTEGYPARLERKTRTIQVSNPKAYNFEAAELTFRNHAGEELSWEEASEFILRHGAFLLDGENETATAKGRQNTALVIVTLKK